MDAVHLSPPPPHHHYHHLPPVSAPSALLAGERWWNRAALFDGAFLSELNLFCGLNKSDASTFSGGEVVVVVVVGTLSLDCCRC